MEGTGQQPRSNFCGLHLAEVSKGRCHLYFLLYHKEEIDIKEEMTQVAGWSINAPCIKEQSSVCTVAITMVRTPFIIWG